MAISSSDYEMIKRRTHWRTLIILSVLAITSFQAQAVIYEVDWSVPDSITGLSYYATTGAMMDGMRVTATFSNSTSETLSWSDMGAAMGGVVGKGWSLTLDGDSFYDYWEFENTTGVGLVSLLLEGQHGLTVFDRTFRIGGWATKGTEDSGYGRDYLEVTPPGAKGMSYMKLSKAIYSRPVGIGAKAPVGDIFYSLEIKFGEEDNDKWVPVPVAGNWLFDQDTDNEIRHSISEPTSIALLSLGVFGLGFKRNWAHC